MNSSPDSTDSDNAPQYLKDSRQKQFLSVFSRDEAKERFTSYLNLKPLGSESVSLGESRGRILASDIISPIDVPGFDRSNVDGFALQSIDTASAQEEDPASLVINGESLLPGKSPTIVVRPQTATPISTGGIVPRGADAVVMIEDTDVVDSESPPRIAVTRSVPPGNMISFAGSDIAKGETVLWAGTPITSREIGVMASLGLEQVAVRRRPQVAIISTGDEVVEPGQPLLLGSVYDSNAAILSAAVQECGGEPILLGRVRDDQELLREIVKQGLQYDLVLLSGGTSKGAGDLSYQVVRELQNPGIVAHGVALKPGKPICLAVTNGKPVVILPGFPTSAIFTFHEFVAPVIRQFAGIPETAARKVRAQLPARVHSDKGRTEYVLVRLFGDAERRLAFPMGKGSGSVTTFSMADGFVVIPQHVEIVDAGEFVEVSLIDEEIQANELVIIGSHCAGLDRVVSSLRQTGCAVSVMHVGSEAGLMAVERGECDLAGIHLYDPQTGQYNTPYLNENLELIEGYRRMQSFVFRKDDDRFSGANKDNFLRKVSKQSDLSMVNRNSGSGTRILIDRLMSEAGIHRPPGYSMQVKSHNAVSAAVLQGRADWGVAIQSVAESYGLETIPIRNEHFDFVVRRENRQTIPIQRFVAELQKPELRASLQQMGYEFVTDSECKNE
ncbi:molybdopterin biosynthesis protein [Thalassoglobus sp. JC818]|uniref:molybdopterin biosynthesis protein n=1 Tax=Thalassoglobus sp. JC818 TaxID=3232136 RepID=UPI00345855B8